MKEVTRDIQLPYMPIKLDNQCQNNANSSRFDNRTKSFSRINPIELLKSMFLLNLVVPLIVNNIVRGRPKTERPSVVFD
jgi:hypothetical protein